MLSKYRKFKKRRKRVRGKPNRMSALAMSTMYDGTAEELRVFHNSKIGKMREGASYMIAGYILLICESFSINFIVENDTRDIALQIRARLPHNYIMRNSKKKDVWGEEEIASALPFSLHRGHGFSMQVLITDLNYMISVNGYHFAKFNHRLSYRAVTTIEVRGDVEDVTVVRSDVKEYPERLPEEGFTFIRTLESPRPSVVNQIYTDLIDHGDLEEHVPSEWRIVHTPALISRRRSDTCLPLPYYGLLHGKALIAGRCLIIEGRIKLLPHSFQINLQQGQNFWPHPVIAFHFDVRFSNRSGTIGKNVVCRSSYYNTQWDEEECTELDTNFRPGKSFSLAILCTLNKFRIFVDRKFLADYEYQMQVGVVDTVYIEGDIKLWDVVLVKGN